MECLFRAGAAEVVPEALESSLMLASHALVLLGVPPRRVLQRIRETRKQRYQLLRGLFHGLSDEADEDEDEALRLHSVVLLPTAYAVGRTIRELRLADSGVVVSAVRRRGIRALEPDAETRFEAGDVVVLMGSPEALSDGEKRLLQR
jgi:CPA2 family monovalent cation:H+ antiporter-2